MNTATTIITIFKALLAPGEGAALDLGIARETTCRAGFASSEEEVVAAVAETGVPHFSQNFASPATGEPHFTQKR
jgi:hypothetical protein